MTTRSVTPSRPGTPLIPPASLTEAQRAEIRDWQRGMIETTVYNDKARDTYLKLLDPETEALAWRVICRGKADHKTVLRLFKQYQSSASAATLRNKYLSSIFRMNLLVAERISTIDPLAAEMNDIADLAHTIRYAQRGYCYHRNQEKRVKIEEIHTEEELAALTAVTLFLHHASNKEWYNQMKAGDFKDASYAKVTGTRMTNRSLDAFLRKHPEEIHRVLDYFNTRDIGITIKDTRALIRHLDESKNLGTLDQGWL